MPVSVQEYRRILEKSFAKAEDAFLKNQHIQVAKKIQEACVIVFASRTQAYREVLLGCLLTRITDTSRDIRLPYLDLGSNAFSGRTLDEQVINPFLHEMDIPCSRGPYLSVFRRQVKFDETTKAGLKDKQGYDAFLGLLAIIEETQDQGVLLAILDYVLYCFVLLREQAKIELVKLERISLNQYKRLISGLLTTPSGGLFPFILVLAMVETVVRLFSVSWEVEFQGINVADKASGAGGDITVKEQGSIVLTIEVTERSVDVPRVQATFKDKIVASTLSDYVFLVHLERIGDAAKQQAEKYFPHGYDVNFVDIQEWLINTLVTIGVKGRKYFQDRIVCHLSGDQIPKVLKVAWNVEIENLTT
jgi:hypothetical protein